MTRLSSKKLGLLATGLAAVGSMAAVAPTAVAASSPVNVTANTTCSAGARQLGLADATGTPLSASNPLDATNGAATFQTSVTDNATCDQGFQVNATMSNLYQNTGGTFTCTNIPSANVSFNQPTSPLSLKSITALLSSPTFTLTTGPISGVTGLSTILGLLGVSSFLTPASPVTGTIPSSLSQTQLGLAAGQLLSGVSSSLPINIATPASPGGNFTAPDVIPAGVPNNCGTFTGATSLPVLSGSQNTVGLLANGVLSYLDTTDGFSGLTAGGTTLAGTTGNGVLSTTQILSAILPASAINTINLLAPAQIQSILSDVTATYTKTIANPSSLATSGLYGAVSNISVNTSGAAAGTYQGTMTLTLLNT